MRRRNVPNGPGHPLHEAWQGHHAFGHFGPPGPPPFPPLPPGPWGHRGRGRGHGRRGRGDVRAAILALLAERPEGAVMAHPLLVGAVHEHSSSHRCITSCVVRSDTNDISLTVGVQQR